MKADYKNWMPRGMVMGTWVGTIAFLVLYLIFGVSSIIPEGNTKRVIGIALLILTVVFCVVTIWMYLMYRAFSYNGKRQMSKQIIEGVASYVSIPVGGKGLDVGCGSGALTIACAKKNPGASFTGIDRWGGRSMLHSAKISVRAILKRKV